MEQGDTLALVTDLLFETRIRGVAGPAGASVACARQLDAFRKHLHGAKLVLVDLEHPEAFEAIPLAVAAGVRVVGFYPHVQAELKQRALAAGASAALARSAFVEKLPHLLGAAAEDPPRDQDA